MLESDGIKPLSGPPGTEHSFYVTYEDAPIRHQPAKTLFRRQNLQHDARRAQGHLFRQGRNLHG